MADDPFAHIKLRKRVSIWPLTITARADYSRRLRAFQYGLTCKVRLHVRASVARLPDRGVHADLYANLYTSRFRNADAWQISPALQSGM